MIRIFPQYAVYVPRSAPEPVIEGKENLDLPLGDIGPIDDNPLDHQGLAFWSLLFT